MEIYKLKYPIPVGGDVGNITEIELKRPKAKHLRTMPTDPGFDDLLKLLSKLSGHPPSTIDELDVEDTIALTEKLGGFFGSGPATGSKD